MNTKNTVALIVVLFIVCMLASYNFAAWKVNKSYHNSKFLMQDFETLESMVMGQKEKIGDDQAKIIQKKIHEIKENVQFINTICLGDS